MKTGKFEMIAAGVFFATLAGAAVAGLQYRNRFTVYNRKFDPEFVDEIEGRIEEIIHAGGDNAEDKGVELILKTGDDLITVHLGPAWYIKHQPEQLKEGDKVLIRGSKSVQNHKDVIIAEWLKRGNYMLRLRFENGHPLWNAWSKD